MAVAVKSPGRAFARPKGEYGLVSWLTTVDHKRIGILYGVTAFIFFLIGGTEALLIRSQLATPNGQILTADQYNMLFTMHGVTMIFLVVMPVAAAFGNFLVPIMVGARDMSFPRLNGFGYWTFLAGGLFLYSSFFFGGAPNGGWFGYAPQTLEPFNGGTSGVDFYLLGLLLTGIASATGSINMIVTVLNLRAPGMTLMRMPIFVWFNVVISALLLFALPTITVAFFLLYFDRNFGSNFYNAAMGGDPVLWQHLFWIFGHPEVYILILPAMGIVSEIVPVFSRKPIFSYPVGVFSGAAIAFVSWGVWLHHMFAVGLGPVATSAFAVSTILISVPTGIMIFNWLATLWRGEIRLATPMLFSLAFIGMFTIGGLSGATHTIVPHDYQQTDTYYIIAHFHYVLFGGAIMGLFGGLYYWFPKITGRFLDDKIGKVHFWLMLLGFNLTFGPMHIIGLQGQPRRTYTYPEGMGWDVWNMVQTTGAFTIALSIVIFIINFSISMKKPKTAPDDPWDGRTLEWATTSPPPVYNFAVIPTAPSLDSFWHEKYTEDGKGGLVRVPAGAADDGHGGGHGDGHGDGHGEGHIHMPSPSYMPLILALGLMTMAYGAVFGWWLFGAGLVVTLAGFTGWGTEPLAE